MKVTRIVTVTVLVFALIIMAAACSPVAKQEVEALKQEIETLKQEVNVVSPTEQQTQAPAQLTEQPVPSASALPSDVPQNQAVNTISADFKVTQDDAINAVKKAYPQYEVGYAEIDYKNGTAYWEVNVYDPKYKDDHDVYVNATTGMVSDYEATSDSGATPGITQQQAEKAVTDKYPGYTIKSVDYDKDNGVYYWEIEIMDKNGFDQDIYVNASDGTIISDRDYHQNAQAQVAKAQNTNQGAGRQNYDDDMYDYDDRYDDHDDMYDDDSYDDDRYDYDHDDRYDDHDDRYDD